MEINYFLLCTSETDSGLLCEHDKVTCQWSPDQRPVMGVTPLGTSMPRQQACAHAPAQRPAALALASSQQLRCQRQRRRSGRHWASRRGGGNGAGAPPPRHAGPLPRERCSEKLSWTRRTRSEEHGWERTQEGPEERKKERRKEGPKTQARKESLFLQMFYHHVLFIYFLKACFHTNWFLVIYPLFISFLCHD